MSEQIKELMREIRKKNMNANTGEYDDQNSGRGNQGRGNDRYSSDHYGNEGNRGIQSNHGNQNYGQSRQPKGERGR